MKTNLILAVLVIIFTSCTKTEIEGLMVKPINPDTTLYETPKPLFNPDTLKHFEVEYRVITTCTWYKRQLSYFGGFAPSGQHYWENFSDTCSGNSSFKFTCIESPLGKKYTFSVSAWKSWVFTSDTITVQLYYDGVLQEERKGCKDNFGNPSIWHDYYP